MPRFLLVLLTIATVRIAAQEAPLPVAFDALGGVSVVAPSGTFRSVSGIPSPGQLTYEPMGGSIGWWFGLGADLPVFNELRGGIRLNLSHASLTYQAGETVPIATEEGGIYLASLSHELTGSFTLLEMQPYMRYEPLSWLSLRLGIPVSFAVSTDYLQTVRFSDPEGLPFVDGSIEQVTGSGDIPNTTAVFGLSLGAEGKFPLTSDENLYLVPHVGFTTMFYSINADGAFTAQSLTIGVGVRYVLGSTSETKTAEVTPPVRERLVTVVRDTTVDLSAQVREPVTTLASTMTDSLIDGSVVRVTVRESYRTLLPKPPSVLRGSLRLSFVHEDGSVSDDARLSAQRIRLERTVPFMPLVIFDDTSSTLPQRYVQLSASEAASWKEASALVDATTHWQYNVLNIIGFRLRVHPAAVCTLLTYDDGTEEGKGLAERRCEAVRNYLTQTFNIPARRLSVEVKRGQASQPAWVMFVEPSRLLVKPITASNIQNETRLPSVRVMPDVVSEAGIEKWSVSMFQSGRAIRTFTDTGAVPMAILWNMNENLETDAVMSQQILVELKLQDKEGATTKSEPGRVVVRSQSVTDATGVPSARVEVLRVLPPDFLATPDRELFNGAPEFTSIEFYPAAVSDDAEYLQSSAPVVRKSVNADVWFRRGLMAPEKDFYQRAELYIKAERRP